MKVLHVVPSLALRHGGVSVSVRELCRGLAALGAEVQIFSTPRGYDSVVDQPADARLKACGVRFSYFSVAPLPWIGPRYAYSRPLRRSLRDGVRWADVVHIHSLWLYPTLAASRACKRAGVPYVLSPCGALDPYSLGVRRLLKQLYGRWVERENLQSAAAVHFTSPFEQRYARTFGATCRGVVIPRSLDLQELPDPQPGGFRIRHPEVGDRKILLFLGRLHPKKRLDLVAETFAHLCRHRNDIHLVIAGPDEGSAFVAQRILSENQILDRVTFTGLVEGKGKWDLLRDAALFLLPSEDENFGVTALEAMAAGVPLLLSPRVGICEEVRRARACLVPELDSAAWADAAQTLLDQPVQAAAMGRAGRHLVETEFSTPRIASRMKALYETVIS